MAYGLKYICTFDNLRLDIPVDPAFTIQFLFKDYDAEAFNIKGGADVVKHSWDTDDPHGTIKGSSLSIVLINEAQSVPLTSFLTLEDDGVKVILLQGAQVMFEGFLVQDDCLETMVDFNHEIKLTANDNLGLLKNINVDVALRATIASFSTNITGTAPNFIRMPSSFGSTVEVGDLLVISGSALDGTYTVTNRIIYLGSRIFTVAESVPDTAIGPATILQERVDLYSLVSLLTLVKVCLNQTGILLPVNIYSNVIETTQDPTITFLEQTLVNPQSFNKGNDDYEDCYTVLEKILKRFNITVFQSSGLYNLVRWDELKYYNNLIHGFIYDADFNYVGPVFGELYLPAPIQAGIAESLIWVSAPDHRVFRPYLYNKETFNYHQPTNLLRNYNLQELGNLIRAYTTGSGDTLQYVNEYQMLGWYDAVTPGGNPAVVADYYIRVVLDSLQNETERYVVLANDNIVATPIEVNEGDMFTYSFSFRTVTGQPVPVNLTWVIRLWDGTNQRFLVDPANAFFTEPGWYTAAGWTYPVLSGDDTTQWHNVEMISKPIPFDGLLYVDLIQINAGGFDDGTYYKDIRFEYTPLINQSTKIIGHTHKSSQGANIKLNEEEEIFIDSSPRNSIAGTLFRNTMNGLLKARTGQWEMPTGAAKNLGEITTSETLNWRRYPRSIIEGTLIGTASLPPFISIINVIKYNYYPDLNFIWGKLEIDYRNNTMTGTLWEMWRDAESDLPYNYEFKYLYSTT